MDNSIRPRAWGTGTPIRPNRGGSTEQYGVNDSEVARLRSLVYSLMGRVKALEDRLSAFSVTGYEDSVKPNENAVAPPVEVGTHYHSFLVYPGTILPAFEVDTDGGAIFQNIWKTFIDATSKNKYEQFDANLGVGSRDWTSWTSLPPSLG